MSETEMTETKDELNQILSEIQKSETEVIRISRKTYKGVSYVDVRLFFKVNNMEEYLPTKKGIAMRKDVFEVFVSDISRANEALL